MTKQCGSCTKCCEGNLKLNVNGFAVKPGSPCYLLTASGCGDYENRPYMPCKWYKCEWLKVEEYPDQFKPNNVNFIIQKKWKNKIEYVTIVKAGTIKASDIYEFMNWCKEHRVNFYTKDLKEVLIVGTDEFLKSWEQDG